MFFFPLSFSNSTSYPALELQATSPASPLPFSSLLLTPENSETLLTLASSLHP